MTEEKSQPPPPMTIAQALEELTALEAKWDAILGDVWERNGTDESNPRLSYVHLIEAIDGASGAFGIANFWLRRALQLEGSANG